jgi:hypothetical protein
VFVPVCARVLPPALAVKHIHVMTNLCHMVLHLICDARCNFYVTRPPTTDAQDTSPTHLLIANIRATLTPTPRSKSAPGTANPKPET